MEQVWFAGVHADVGGGYRESGLSDIALLWMVEQAEAAGLKFDRDYLKAVARPDALAKQHRSYRGIYWAKGLCLPSGTGMTDEELERVIGVIRGCWG